MFDSIIQIQTPPRKESIEEIKNNSEGKKFKDVLMASPIEVPEMKRNRGASMEIHSPCFRPTYYDSEISTPVDKAIVRDLEASSTLDN